MSAANRELNKTRAKHSAERDHLAAKLNKVEHQLDHLINAIADGLKSPGLQGKPAVLDSERVAIKAQLSAPPPSPVRLHPNLADAYRSKVVAVRDALFQNDTKAEAFEIMRGLIEKVVIHHRPGQTAEIELIGDIAVMMEISMQGPHTRKAARDRAAFDGSMVR